MLLFVSLYFFFFFQSFCYNFEYCFLDCAGGRGERAQRGVLGTQGLLLENNRCGSHNVQLQRQHTTHCWCFLIIIKEEHSSSQFCPIHSKFLLQRRKCQFVKTIFQFSHSAESKRTAEKKCHVLLNRCFKDHVYIYF